VQDKIDLDNSTNPDVSILMDSARFTNFDVPIGPLNHNSLPSSRAVKKRSNKSSRSGTRQLSLLSPTDRPSINIHGFDLAQSWVK
jgi:hypothetical protein